MKSRMTSIYKTAAIVALGLLSFSGVQAEELRIGHVSSARIMREASAVKSADAKIKKEFSKREKELVAMADRLKAKVAKLEKDMPVLAESDRAKRQGELAELDRELQQKHRAFRQDLAQKRNEESAAFSKQLEKAIKKVVAAEKLDLIVQDALYHNPKIDVTEKVLEELNN